MNSNKNDLKWHEDGGMITTLIIAVVVITIIVSQSFAVGGSLISFSSIINHNSLYLFILIYFGLLCFPVGKRYFNYLNVFLVFIYLICGITSFLTLLHSFGLNTIINFLINVVLFIYLSHTMFRGTTIWKNFNLKYSPFNEISNDGYFLTIVVLLVISLIVNLISTVVVSGLFLSILDTLYLLLFSRYIYLYRDYLDFNQLDSDFESNYDIKEHIDKIGEKIEKTNIDDVLSSVSDKIVNVTEDVISKKSNKKSSDSVKKRKTTTGTKSSSSKVRKSVSKKKGENE